LGLLISTFAFALSTFFPSASAAKSATGATPRKSGRRNAVAAVHNRRKQKSAINQEQWEKLPHVFLLVQAGPSPAIDEIQGLNPFGEAEITA
jgi:hypothetical protein